MKNKIDDALISAVFSTPSNEIRKNDYAIVHGWKPEQAIKRAQYALHFYRRGGTEKIIVSGGVKHEYCGEILSESEIMKKFLLQNGVPETAIIADNSAEDTVQNMVCSLVEMCKSTGVYGVKSVTVITEPFHMLRSLLLADIYLPNYFNVYGYSEEWEEQRNLAQKDIEFRKTVENEINLIRAFLTKCRNIHEIYREFL